MKIDTIDTKYGIITTNKFNKNLKKVYKQGKDLNKLKTVIKTLANGESLDFKYKDHSLIDNKYYKNVRECHIEPDWLLIYKYKNDELILYLLETGSHNDLFDK